MTEKEKMLRNEIYDPNHDPELIGERKAVKELCCEYNRLMPSEKDRAKELIRRIFGKTGENFHIEPAFFCDYGYNIEIGEAFYSNHNLVILDAGGVSFGDNVMIGPDCGFHTSGHPLDAKRRNQGLEYAKAIKVGDNVWFGAGVHVLPGVTIGSNSVIGAGSIVNRDIPSGVVAAGNPCRVIRTIEQ